VILLLDSNILIDAIRGRNFAAFQAAVESRHQLATSAVSIGEIYAGTRPPEEGRTAELLSKLECYPVTAAIGRHAGELLDNWGRRGRTLQLPDMLIAATAIEHGLALMTDNRKDFPMPELTFYPPEPIRT
jgi:predicted nucleic acid-binding protein